MASELLARLASATTYVPDTGSVQTNRKLWDSYSSSWRRDAPHVARMAASVGRAAADLRVIGDEWSDAGALAQVISDFVAPALAATPPGEADVCEIGPGGGRLALTVLPQARSYHAVDVSAGMLAACRAALDAALPGHAGRARYTLLDGTSSTPLPHADVRDGGYDVVLAFDVLVHCDLHTHWHYLQAIRRMLRPGGRAVASFATLATPLGWERFAAQKSFSEGGFYFTAAETVRLLAARAGLAIVRESAPTGDCMYYDRDFVVLLRRDDE